VIDTACVGLHLIDAGHHPESAERWCVANPAYAEAISAFVLAQRKLWHEISTANCQPWTLELAAAADRWVSCRAVRPLL
jgi:hypothetical protein